jgi:hypothetical protein
LVVEWLLSFSFVSQSFFVTVVGLGAEFAFMRASNLARCSGLNRASNSAGIGTWPLLVEVTVLSHKPVFTFNGWNLFCAQAAEENNNIAITVLFIRSSGLISLYSFLAQQCF